MSLADAAFVLGPIGAVILVPAALCAITVSSRTRWALWICVPLAWIGGIAFVRFWYVWGQAFDRADAYQAVPHELNAAQDLAMYVCAAAAFAAVTVVVAALTAALTRRVAVL